MNPNNFEELVDVVDADDKVLYSTKREEVYKKGLLHRASTIILFNSKGEIFLQQRSKNKKFFPSYWDLSASEQVLAGETYQSAAVRGLKEELNVDAEVEEIRGVHFQDNSYQIAKTKLINIEKVVLFKTVYEGQIKIDKAELEKGQFLSPRQIEEMISQNALFTVWFFDEWNYLKKQKIIKL